MSATHRQCSGRYCWRGGREWPGEDSLQARGSGKSRNHHASVLHSAYASRICMPGRRRWQLHAATGDLSIYCRWCGATPSGNHASHPLSGTVGASHHEQPLRVAVSDEFCIWTNVETGACLQLAEHAHGVVPGNIDERCRDGSKD